MSDETEDRAPKPGMEECATCEGTEQLEGEPCNACEGTGEVPAKEPQTGGNEGNSADPELEKRDALAKLLEGTIEKRGFDADMEIRSTSDGGLKFTGYASSTETPYPVMNFTETICRGAFKQTLGENPDTVLLVNHDGMPLARTSSGTMTLSEDSRGLRVDAELDPKNPDV